jgi:hypothetical protein
MSGVDHGSAPGRLWATITLIGLLWIPICVGVVSFSLVLSTHEPTNIPLLFSSGDHSGPTIHDSAVISRGPNGVTYGVGVNAMAGAGEGILAVVLFLLFYPIPVLFCMWMLCYIIYRSIAFVFRKLNILFIDEKGAPGPLMLLAYLPAFLLIFLFLYLDVPDQPLPVATLLAPAAANIISVYWYLGWPSLLGFIIFCYSWARKGIRTAL